MQSSINSSDLQNLRIKTEDGTNRNTSLRKKQNVLIHNLKQPDEKTIQNYAAMKLTNYQTLISPGFKIGQDIKQKERNRLQRYRKESLEEREKSNEKYQKLLNEVFDKSAGDLNMSMYQKFNLTTLQKENEKYKRPKCNNLMLKYDEKILKQEVKALDPNAYLIRQQEHDFHTKKLYSLNVASPKSIQQMMQSYCIKSTNINYNYSNVRKPSTSLNSTRNSHNMSTHISNSQLPYLKLHQRLVNFQKNDKKNDITQVTFITQDSPEKEAKQYLNFFEDKENMFDTSDLKMKQKNSARQQQLEMFLKEGDDNISVVSLEYLSKQNSRPSSCNGYSFQEISEEDKKRLEQLKIDTYDPKFEVFTLENKIQGKYEKIYDFLSTKVADAEEKKNSKTYKIYHNQGAIQQKVNTCIGQQQQLMKLNSTEGSIGKLVTMEQEQNDLNEQISQPLSPINPNVFRRYKHILSSPESSPSKKNKSSANFQKIPSLEIEDFQSVLQKKRSMGKDDILTIKLQNAKLDSQSLKDFTPKEQAELIIAQKLKEFSKIDETRVKRVLKIELHREKEKWEKLKEGELTEEKINQILQIYEEEQQNKESEQQKKIIKLKDLQNQANLESFYGGKQPNFISNPNKRNSFNMNVQTNNQSTNDNSIQQSPSNSIRNNSTGSISLQNKDTETSVKKPKISAKFNLAHLYLNNQNDEDEIKKQRLLKAKEIEENKKKGISQGLDLRQNILRIQKNLYKKRNVKLYMLSQHKLDEEFDVVCKDLQMISEKNKPPPQPVSPLKKSTDNKFKNKA